MCTVWFRSATPLFVSALVTASLSGPAAADLQPRLGGLALYDTDRNITLLADAAPALTNDRGITNVNGRMLHYDALRFIDALNAEQYLGVSDWRLPNAAVPDPTCTSDTAGTTPSGNNNGYNCTGGDLGHLFYGELGGIAGQNISTSTDPDLALIQNLHTGGAGDSTYWTGTYSVVVGGYGDLPYELSFNNGQQLWISPVNNFWAWPVRDGDITGGVTLEFYKRSNLQHVNVSEPFVYSFEIINTGASDATGVVITDLLPEGVSIVAPLNPECLAQNVGTRVQVTCDLGTVAAGSTAVLDLDVFAPPYYTVLDNEATVVADQLPGPITATDTIVVTVASVELGVYKAAPAEAPVGAPLTYTVTVYSSGPGNSTAVALTDELPPEVEFVSADTPDGVCNYDSGTRIVTCDLDVTVLNGVPPIFTRESIDVEITVVPTRVGVVTNTARVEGAEYDQVPETNTSSATTNIVFPNLSIRDTRNAPRDLLLDFGNVVIGDRMTANVILTNTSSSPLDRISIGSPAAVAPPFGIIAEDCFATTLAGGALPGENCQLTVEFAPVETGSFEQVIELPLSSAATGAVIAPIRLTGNGVTLQADIGVTKEADKLDLAQGDTVTFTVTVQNFEGVPAAVKVRDKMPAPLTVQSFTASQGNYNPTSGVWTVGVLAPEDGPRTLQVVALVGASTNNASPCVSNVADAFIDDPSITEIVGGAANRATVTMSIGGSGCADIAITDATQRFADGLVYWDFAIANYGPGKFNGPVQFEIRPPRGSQFIDLARTATLGFGVVQGEIVSSAPFPVPPGSNEAGNLMLAANVCDPIYASGFACVTTFSIPVSCAPEAPAECGVTAFAAVTGTRFTGGIRAEIQSLSTPDPDPSNNSIDGVRPAPLPLFTPTLNLAVTLDVQIVSLTEWVAIASLTNEGPNDATSVRLGWTFPRDFFGIRSSQPSPCLGPWVPVAGQTEVCSMEIGNLASGATTQAVLSLEPLALCNADPSDFPTAQNLRMIVSVSETEHDTDASDDVAVFPFPMEVHEGGGGGAGSSCPGG